MLRDMPQERDPLADTRVPENGTNRAKATCEQVSERTPERAPVTAYWLIAKHENSRLEILASGLAGCEEAVPVFSHEEEAEMFLRLWERGCDGW
jgi:nitrous oxide reductase accessory protein NosL